jgi:hypothetical protein
MPCGAGAECGIYLFNVLYSIENKTDLLTKITQIAKPGAVLAVFDYTTETHGLQLKDLAEKSMHPLVVEGVVNVLNELVWDVIEVADLSVHFLGSSDKCVPLFMKVV